MKALALMLALAAGLLGTLGLGGCGDPPWGGVYVTVAARPTVHGARKLHVELSVPGGGVVAQDFALDADTTFPVTFTITPREDQASLRIVLLAQDAQGQAVARGETVVDVATSRRTDADVVLEPEDFVLNSGLARTQYLAFRDDLAGRQLAARPDGSFLVGFENDCPIDRCDILGRLFDETARPATNQTSLDDRDFVLNLTNDYTVSPSVVAGKDGYLAVWITQPSGSTIGDVKAAALDAQGKHLTAKETVLSAAPENDLAPTAIAQADGSYVVVWERDRPMPAVGREIRGRLVGANGDLLTNPITSDASDFPVSADTIGVQRLAHATALSGGGFVVVWEDSADDTDTAIVNVHGRIFSPEGQPVGPDRAFTTYAAGGGGFPHVAAAADGGFFLLWQQLSDTYPQLMRRYAADGAPLGPESVVGEATTDPFSVPSIAVRPSDGALGVAWADCMESGDGEGCGIRFRLLHPWGLPSGDLGFANSTTVGDQKAAALVALGEDAFFVAWTDGSGLAPDTDGSGIRGRALYPSLERHDGKIGAACGSDQDEACGEGLTCALAASAPSTQELCHPLCADPDGTPCAGGGRCTAGICQF